MKNYERVKSDPLSAQLYAERKPSKHKFEMNMVAEAFQLLPASEIKTVIDAPCGVGRLSVWLCQQGFDVTGVDLGEGALELTRKLLADNHQSADVRAQDIFSMDFADDNFDASVCFRLLHHFEEKTDQQALIKELCRISSKYVVISYISAYSTTSLRRKLRKRLSGKPIKQNPNSLVEIKTMFEENNFQHLGSVKRSPLLHSLQLAVFSRSQ